MNKRFTLWLVTAVLIIVSLPGLFMRWDTESANQTYEFAIPLDELSDIANDDEELLDDGIRDLRDAGLQAISLMPMSLNDLNKRNIISVFSKKELERMLHFTDVSEDYKQEAYGFYVTLPEDPYYDEVITSRFDTVDVTINDKALYFIEEEQGDHNVLEDLGYDKKQIEFIKSYDLNYILRASNDEKDVNERIVQDLLNFADDPHFSNVLFSGTEVIGHLDPSTPDAEDETDKVRDYASALDEAGLSFYSIEFSDQIGMNTLAQTTDYNIIRLFSLDLNEDTFDSNVNRIIRAVKERNIRSAFIHPLISSNGDGFDYTIEFMEKVSAKMPDHFTLGTPSSFNDYQVPIWSQLAALLAGVVLTYLIVDYFRLPLLSYGLAGGMFVLMIAYFILQKVIFLQAFGLAIAILTPTYAIVSMLRHPSAKIGVVSKKYFSALFITATGLLVLLGTLNGIGFISGFEMFRGVKLLYILPVLLVTLIMFWTKDMHHLAKTNQTLAISHVKKTLNQPIRYLHLIVLIIVGGIGVYYITRTGNAGSVSSLEILFRDKLEEMLYVRPRTKEFLIGLPIFMLGLYVMGINKRWGKIILIPGSIGLLSIMNTFTHFHIPLDISILRTVYGIFLGYLVGLVYIYIFRLLYRYVPKLIKER